MGIVVAIIRSVLLVVGCGLIAFKFGVEVGVALFCLLLVVTIKADKSKD